MSQRELALKWLKSAFGAQAEFRADQWESIEAMVRPNSAVFVVQGAAWGKSAAIFLAIKLLNEQQRTPAIVISPLVALMRNQVGLAEKLGINSAILAPKESQALNDWIRGSTNVLYVSPHALTPLVGAKLKEAFERSPGIVVLDEAQCGSSQSAEFRSEYDHVMHWLCELDSRTRIVLSSSTATDSIIADLSSRSDRNLQVFRGPLRLKHIAISIFEFRRVYEKLAWTAKYLSKLPGSGLIYVRAREDAELVARFLNSLGISVESYHAELSAQERIRLERAFDQNELKALVTTSALGMGYDKLDLDFVIHFHPPLAAESYYSQIGRSGRAARTAYAAMLAVPSDFLKRGEQTEIGRFASAPGCRMRNLVDYLGEHESFDCGICDRCRPHNPAPDLGEFLSQAQGYLSPQVRTIEPRRVIQSASGRIPIPERLQFTRGYSLSQYNDPGIGANVKRAKYSDIPFADELVDEFCNVYESSGFRADRLTIVPSRHGEKLRSLARAISVRLNLQFEDVLKIVRSTQPQKLMSSSEEQMKNVAGAFQVTGPISGAWILLDDIVDSRWTLTFAAKALLESGASAVMPIVLANARSRNRGSATRG